MLIQIFCMSVTILAEINFMYHFCLLYHYAADWDYPKDFSFFSDMMSDKIERVYQWGLRRLLAHPLCHYDSSNIYEANLNS